MQVKEEWLQENGLYKCPYCNIEKTKKGICSHIILKHEGKISSFVEYNKRVKNKEIKKINQYTKAKELGLPKPIFSEESLKLMSDKAKERIKNGYWTLERRQKISKSMQEAVKKYPNSYSANNVCGRTKMINYIDSLGNETKLNGSWELEVAEYLNKKKIKWTNIFEKGFEYIWNGNKHLYFPDFYLPELNLYIEVKGYERERDRCKWKSLENLIIIKNKEIKLIKENKFMVL